MNSTHQNFDKALFQSFIKVLTQKGYICTNEDNAIVYDEQLTNVAQYADLVLDEVKLQMLHHITSLPMKNARNG